MSTSNTGPSLPYHEPDITTILILSSFLLTLNVINYAFDKVIYAGLLGQILVGIAWGTPGRKLLGVDIESTIVNLGYLGLLLLVYEGGLSTSFQSLKANLWLSTCIAFTGIAIPIGLSYVLMVFAGATALQAFAAGAALCSTSLGTTFTVLQTSNLTTTRLGIVLTTAAMMDDVVGLVIVQVISNLGANSTSFSAVTVIRPILVSLAFGLIVPMSCQYVVLPMTMWLERWQVNIPKSPLWRLLSPRQTAFVIHTGLLMGMVTSATYAGTSNLFAAYLTGAAISWWDSETSSAASPDTISIRNDQNGIDTTENHCSGTIIFERYYFQTLNHIFKPFFFASIGFSIPITRMFTGGIIWLGGVYTILMFIGKFACGLWLVQTATPSRLKSIIPMRLRDTKEVAAIEPTLTPGKEAGDSAERQISTRIIAESTRTTSTYPGAIVGCAMVARGEVGLLILSVAEANRIWGEEANAPLFLIVTWAILLCTFIGPILVGLLVGTLKRTPANGNNNLRVNDSNLLGVWGVG